MTTAKKSSGRRPAGRPEPEPAPDETTAAGGERSPVDGIVDDFVELSIASLQAHAELLRRAGRRLAGEDRADASGWVEDATQFWGIVARDQVKLTRLLTDLMGAATAAASKASS